MADLASRPNNRFASTVFGMVGRRVAHRAPHMGILLVTFAVILAVLASPQPANAWRQGGAFIGPGAYVGPQWGVYPGAVFPGVRPLPGYRFAFPPGAPFSYSDPNSGTTYCLSTLSQSTGFYYECGFSTSGPYSTGPFPPMPPGPSSPYPDQGAPMASGVLMFRMPQGSEVAVDSVPIGLSDGQGIIAVTPGRHQVVLRVGGKETEQTVTVGTHKILTITPTSIVATEP